MTLSEKPSSFTPQEGLVEAEKLSDKVLAFGYHARPLLKLLREDVTVDELLQDRLSQAYIDYFLEVSRDTPRGGYFDEFSKKGDQKFKNPFPSIQYGHIREGKKSGGGNYYITFMLNNDNEHIYFFDYAWSLPEYASTFLREEDIVPTSCIEQLEFHSGGAFTKPLQRATIKGGPIEYYNYLTQKWELDIGDRSDPIKKRVISNANKLIGVSLSSRSRRLISRFIERKTA
ncbi:MAG: hypothetical protein A2W22_02310 [Candidatus Levybacteria bacterium RBG_16_35_11]|nr:MAG: hypothetical protein A2W22_02310 [Candidatus Levybacteria bacterium RBG_16_35_11]